MHVYYIVPTEPGSVARTNIYRGMSRIAKFSVYPENFRLPAVIKLDQMLQICIQVQLPFQLVLLNC